MDWLDTLVRDLQEQSPEGVTVTRVGPTLVRIEDGQTWVEAGDYEGAIVDQWEIFTARDFHASAT